MMEKETDYASVPHGYVHCFHASCPQADACLRRLAGRLAPASVPHVLAMNPAAYPPAGEACPWFRPVRRIRMAWGVRQAVGRMPYKEGRGVVSALNRMYSKVTLNRITNHQRPLPPAEQKQIEALFARYGLTDGQVFDRVEMVYDWEG